MMPRDDRNSAELQHCDRRRYGEAFGGSSSQFKGFTLRQLGKAGGRLE